MKAIRTIMPFPEQIQRQTTHEEVQAKNRAALRWCACANQHLARHGGKRWHYLLLPNTAIQLGRSVKTLFSEFFLSKEIS